MIASVAQWNRAADFESAGRGFESLRMLHLFSLQRKIFIKSCYVSG